MVPIPEGVERDEEEPEEYFGIGAVKEGGDGLDRENSSVRDATLRG